MEALVANDRCREHDEPELITTRRGALKAGGGSALGLLVAALGGGTVAFAEQATPAAGAAEGGYAVIRVRQVRSDRSDEELLELVREGFVPLLVEIPGFISYTAIADPASRTQAFIAVFEDKAGADESTRVAGEWLVDNGIDDYADHPIVAEGAIAFTIT